MSKHYWVVVALYTKIYLLIICWNDYSELVNFSLILLNHEYDGNDLTTNDILFSYCFSGHNHTVLSCAIILRKSTLVKFSRLL